MDDREELPEPDTPSIPPPAEASSPAQPERMKKKGESEQLKCFADCFYINITSRLLGFVKKLGVPRSRREDVVQETWRDALEYRMRRPGAHTEAEMRSLLERIAHDRVVDMYRKLDAHRIESLDALAMELMAPNSAASVNAVEEREWMETILRKLQGRIGERDRWLLCQHKLERRTIKDLARETGLTASAVKNRIQRALAELRCLYFEEERCAAIAREADLRKFCHFRNFFEPLGHLERIENMEAKTEQGRRNGSGRAPLDAIPLRSLLLSSSGRKVPGSFSFFLAGAMGPDSFREVHHDELDQGHVFPKRRPYRRPTVKLGVERLEERDCPSALWVDTDKNNKESDANNWFDTTKGVNGVLPSATVAALFDPTATNGQGQVIGSSDNITWDLPITCHGIIVRNGYQGSFTMSANQAVTTNANFSIDGKSTVTFLGANNTPMTLTNGADVTVAAGGKLVLNDQDITAGVTFFKAGDANPEILSNAGTVNYIGHANLNTRIQDYILIPIANSGTFNVYGGNGGQPPTIPDAGGQSLGSQLNVKGSNVDTDNVTWYQEGAAAVTALSGNVYLSLQMGYTQTDGILKTDNFTETLEANNNGAYGTINIQGGKVQVDPGDKTGYAVFNIMAQTMKLAGEIDETVSGDLTGGDKIDMSGVPSSTLSCVTGSKVVLSENGDIKGGIGGLFILQTGTGGITGTLSLNNAPPGMEMYLDPENAPTSIRVKNQ